MSDLTVTPGAPPPVNNPGSRVLATFVRPGSSRIEHDGTDVAGSPSREELWNAGSERGRSYFIDI